MHVEGTRDERQERRALSDTDCKGADEVSHDKITYTNVDDGKNDVNIKVNGELLIHIPEAGYRAVGLSFDQAKEFAKATSELIMACADLAAKPSPEEPVRCLVRGDLGCLVVNDKCAGCGTPTYP
jgi:hypothetical protein